MMGDSKEEEKASSPKPYGEWIDGWSGDLKEKPCSGCVVSRGVAFGLMGTYMLNELRTIPKAHRGRRIYASTVSFVCFSVALPTLLYAFAPSSFERLARSFPDVLLPPPCHPSFFINLDDLPPDDSHRSTDS